MKIFFMYASLFVFSAALAQEDKPKVIEDKPKAAFNIEGQISVSTNGKAVWYNMGGPAIKFNFNKFSFSINMLPSLKFEDEKNKPIVTPILGGGPQFYFLKKRFILSIPCYYIASRNSWEITGGLGFVLTKPKP